MTTYIQRYGQRQRETVDEFETNREACQMVREYRFSDPLANYYLSQRACKDWADDKLDPNVCTTIKV